MGDHFERLVDVEAAIEEAEKVREAAVQRFLNLGLITGPPDKECVLLGTGYRPGPSVVDFYNPGTHETPFWRFQTCGVEPKVGRHFNYWALGPACDGYVCPECQAEIAPGSNSRFEREIGSAAGEWMEQSDPAQVSCPSCRNALSITQWVCKPPFGFGNLSFSFWNWPRLDSPSWRIDIAGILKEVSGHMVIRTYGKI
jgi:hypothetical protein